MKCFLAIFAVLTFATVTAGQTSFDLNSLTYYGTGSNRSAFVVDWNNGASNEVLAWGYNWSGTVTMSTMMTDIADADPNFFIRWDGDASGFGPFVFGLGHQNGATPFDVTGAVDKNGHPVSSAFVNGIWDISQGTAFDAPATFSGTAANPGDSYIEGDAWSSYVAGSDPDFSTSKSETSQISPDSWTATSLGIGSVELDNEGWYGFGNNRAPTTIPEPSTVLLLMMGGISAFAVSKRRRHRSN